MLVKIMNLLTSWDAVQTLVFHDPFRFQIFSYEFSFPVHRRKNTWFEIFCKS